MATRQARTPAAFAPSATDSIQSVKHNARRKNIPPAGIEAQGQVQQASRVGFEYNPQLPPRLRFSDDPAQADRLPLLLQTARERALTEDEARELATAPARQCLWPGGFAAGGVTLTQVQVGPHLKSALGMPVLPVNVMIVTASLPIGTHVFLFAQRYEVAQDLVTASMAVSAVLGLATITLVMSLVGLMG